MTGLLPVSRSMSTASQRGSQPIPCERHARPQPHARRAGARARGTRRQGLADPARRCRNGGTSPASSTTWVTPAGAGRLPRFHLRRTPPRSALSTSQLTRDLLVRPARMREQHHPDQRLARGRPAHDCLQPRPAPRPQRRDLPAGGMCQTRQWPGASRPALGGLAVIAERRPCLQRNAA
jgi:hypothetical protein